MGKSDYESPCGHCGGLGKVPGPGMVMGLARQREKLGISKAEMARRIGIAVSYLHDLEKGNRRMSAHVAARYQQVLQAYTMEVGG